MGKFLVGLAIGMVLLPLCAFGVIWFGYAPVATAAPPLPLERWLAARALKARISRDAPTTAPIAPTEETLLAGARAYRDVCAVCHGLPGKPKTATASGMYPPPPQLFEGNGVTRTPVGVTYWKISNGIRLTGMPAYGQAVDATAIWQLAELLAHANELAAPVREVLTAPAPPK
jgi:thiosulfate dehydrogenase